MSRLFTRFVLASIVCLLFAAPASAQPYDHLKCYKFRDVQLFDSAAADIDTIEAQFGLQNCQIKKKAKQFCIPASKAVTAIANGTDTPFAAQDLVYEQICYKVTCPRVTIPNQQLSDQFGTRIASGFKASMLCVPAVIGLPPTTTTTTTSTTTTSTTTTTVGATFSLQAGDASNQTAISVKVDGAGNVLAVGAFAGSSDFGAGPLTSAGMDDIFVVKLDPSGAVIWNLQFGDASQQSASDVALDSGGRIVVTGLFQGSVDFGGGPLTSAGSNDVFIAKLDVDGSHLWSGGFGGTTQDNGFAVAVDSSDAVIFTGNFTSSSIDFGGGPLPLVGTSDGFVAKLDSAGTHLWSKSFGGAGSTLTIAGVDTDAANNVVFDGGMTAGIDFGGGVLTSSGSIDIVVVKLSSVGSHVWSKRYGDAATQAPLRLAVDSLGNVIFTGSASGSIDFGGGPLTSAGSSDIVLAKLDSSGTHVWSHIYGDAGTQQATGVTTDASDNVIACGAFGGTVNFGGSPLTSGGGNDIYVVKLNSAGTHVSSQAFGDAGASQQGNGVATDSGGNRYLVGTFNGTVDFGDGPLTTAGGTDLFIAKLAP
jgi:hypothetical protein